MCAIRACVTSPYNQAAASGDPSKNTLAARSRIPVETDPWHPVVGVGFWIGRELERRIVAVCGEYLHVQITKVAVRIARVFIPNTVREGQAREYLPLILCIGVKLIPPVGLCRRAPRQRQCLRRRLRDVIHKVA